MTIVIAMAGLSQRFVNEGIIIPKYMLYAKNNSLFELALKSFSNYFKSAKFVFIARDVFSTKIFIENECRKLGVKTFSVVILEKETRGQAETVYIGLKKDNIDNSEPIIIFNIDTFRNNFVLPKNICDWDGYLEVFEGSGSNWSYARTESKFSTRVVETAEKVEISTHCSTGLYYFSSCDLFFNSYENSLKNQSSKELYVAPLYNHLISIGYNIQIDIIEKRNVTFCGVPIEYYDFLKTIIK